MKDPESLHLKLQEYADCYSESDAARELDEISKKGAGDEKTGEEVFCTYCKAPLTLKGSQDDPSEMELEEDF